MKELGFNVPTPFRLARMRPRLHLSHRGSFSDFWGLNTPYSVRCSETMKISNIFRRLQPLRLCVELALLALALFAVVSSIPCRGSRASPWRSVFAFSCDGSLAARLLPIVPLIPPSSRGSASSDLRAVGFISRHSTSARLARCSERVICVAPLPSENQPRMKDCEGDSNDAHDCGFQGHEKPLVVEQAAMETGLQLGDAV